MQTKYVTGAEGCQNIANRSYKKTRLSGFSCLYSLPGEQIQRELPFVWLQLVD